MNAGSLLIWVLAELALLCVLEARHPGEVRALDRVVVAILALQGVMLVVLVAGDVNDLLV